MESIAAIQDAIEALQIARLRWVNNNEVYAILGQALMKAYDAEKKAKRKSRLEA